MGHPELITLKVDHLATGVTRLIELLQDHERLEAAQKYVEELLPTYCQADEPNIGAGVTFDKFEFPDGVAFELYGWFGKEDWRGAYYDLCMRWSSLEQLTRRPDGRCVRKSPFLRFEVLVNSIDMNPDDGQENMADPEMDIGLCKESKALLDPFAMHRLCLPTVKKPDVLVGLEWLVQLILRAAKSGHLRAGDGSQSRIQDEAFLAFRKYAVNLRIRKLKALDEAQRDAAIDKVFERLYMSEFGHGFLVPETFQAFRAYVRRAFAGAVADLLKPTKKQFVNSDRHRGRSSSPFTEGDVKDISPVVGMDPPDGIEEAADRLDVSPSTVWRRMNAHGYSELTPEAWDVIEQEIREKALWRDIKDVLVDRGHLPEAARKQVQRWKNKGADPKAIALKIVRDGECE